MFVLEIYEKVCTAGKEELEVGPVFVKHEGSMILIQDFRSSNWVSHCTVISILHSLIGSCDFLVLSATALPTSRSESTQGPYTGHTAHC